ncbi:MAG TPA: peptidoglycan-binding domain-containing protein, partial [Coriobacteriia bacterium]|nr:peptidoglycan-binding domain-containing protein [Coriobacteriia bacterium]
MFEPIAPGDRGSAVEDVQQRLLVLGYDLGPTGVDGVFLGATDTAVRAFQESHDLDEDGVIGPRTWSALV